MLLIQLLSACAPLPGSVSPEEVITLEVCPDDDLCEPNADGVSVVAVHACVAADATERVDPLDLELRLSSGEWLDAGGGDTLTVSMVEDPCVQGLFSPDTGAPLVLVEAEAVGLRVEERLWLNPASFGAVQLTPSSAALSGDSFEQMALTLQAFGPSGGDVSAGTRFEIEVLELVPSDASASIWPTQGFLEGGGAQVDLTLSGAPDELLIQATVSPPDWDQAPAPPEAKSVTLRLLSAGE